MVDLRKKPEIIQRHLTGNTNRQIARDIGLNRKTVDKYVREWREAQAAAVREAVEATTGAPLREPSSTLDTATQFCDHRIADSLIEVPDESPLVATTSALESHMLAVKMAPAAIGSRRGKRRIIQPWRGSGHAVSAQSSSRPEAQACLGRELSKSAPGPVIRLPEERTPCRADSSVPPHGCRCQSRPGKLPGRSPAGIART